MKKTKAPEVAEDYQYPLVENIDFSKTEEEKEKLKRIKKAIKNGQKESAF